MLMAMLTLLEMLTMSDSLKMRLDLYISTLEQSKTINMSLFFEVISSTLLNHSLSNMGLRLRC